MASERKVMAYHLECPECEDEHVVGPESRARYCGLCAGDNGRDVLMLRRPLYPATPEPPEQTEGGEGRWKITDEDCEAYRRVARRYGEKAGLSTVRDRLRARLSAPTQEEHDFRDWPREKHDG